MASQQLLGLPPISPDLKPILPYLQRAEELKVHEPIIAYWCAYYAAQLGIGFKARDNASRDFLFNLLGALESMKQEIGSDDAIEIESASAAFVENFALKVFQSADNEDRRGAVTRTTAKKFLAASNFLEVLKTFPKAEVSESNEEKIRYAKWKAADISKALREGRKPLPGPADQEPDVVPQSGLPFAEHAAASTPSDQHREATSYRVPSPSSTNQGGAPLKPSQAHNLDEGESSTRVQPESIPGPRTVTVSEVAEDPDEMSSPLHPQARSHERSPEYNKRVQFSSSTEILHPSSSPPKIPSPKVTYQGPSSIYAPPERKSPSPTFSMSSVSSRSRAETTILSPPKAPVSPIIHSSANQVSNIYSSSPPRSYPTPVPPTLPPLVDISNVELTPSLIAKVQRHCRFAISSLDYEDAEQAKKELRNALSLLGGL